MNTGLPLFQTTRTPRHVRVGLGSKPLPRSPAAGATLYRGARMALADRRSLDVALSSLTAFASVPTESDDNSTPRRVRSFVKASRMNVALGLFDCLESAPRRHAEANHAVHA